MGDLIRNTTDLAISVSPDVRRFPMAEFTHALDYSYVTFTISKPGLYYSWTAIYTAFAWMVWTMVIISVILTTMIFYLIGKIDKRKNGSQMDLFSTGMYLLGYLVGQDVYLVPKFFSSKLTYQVWLYYGLVIGAAYGCSLQALIVSPGKESVPRTFMELVHSSHYKWGAASGFRSGLGELLFKNSENPIMRDIYHGMEGDKDTIACNLRAASSKYACFNWEIFQQFYFQTIFAEKNGNHPFQTAADKTFFIPMTYAVKTGELFLSYFNDALRMSFDMGLSREMIKEDWRNYRLNLVKMWREGTESQLSPKIIKKAMAKSSDLDNFKGSFFILVSGLVISLVCLVLEKLFNSRINVTKLK